MIIVNVTYFTKYRIYIYGDDSTDPLLSVVNTLWNQITFLSQIQCREPEHRLFFSFLLSSLQKLTEFSYTLMAKFLNINQFECCRRDSCKEICLESQELLMISYFLSSWRSLYKKFLQNKKSPLSGRKSPGLEVSCNFECPVYRTSPLVNLQQCHGRFPS